MDLDVMQASASNPDNESQSPAKTFNAKLKEFKITYLPHNVYIHPCNNPNCMRWGQALHLESCVLCGHENICYDADTTVPAEVIEEVSAKIFELNIEQ